MQALFQLYRDCSSNLAKSRILFAPISYLLRNLFPVCRRHYTRIVLLGFLASATNGAAYLLILPLLDRERVTDPIRLPAAITLAPDVWNYLGYIAVVFLLLASSLHLKFLLSTLSLKVLRASTVQCAIDGALKLRQLATPADGSPDAAETATALQRILGKLSFACGFASKQISLSVTDLLQFGVFFVIWLYVSTGLTLSLVTISVFPALLYLRSYVAVAEGSGTKQQLTAESRKAVRVLQDQFFDTELSNTAIREEIRKVFDENAPGKLLAQKIRMRLEMKRGATLIEQIYPPAVVLLIILSLNFPVLGISTGELVLYVLALRQAVLSMRSIAANTISINKFQSQLSCYMKLMEGTPDLGCLTNSGGAEDTE